jgi:diacylglycerol O-acyltransferase
MFKPMDVTAQGFMIAESRNTPMHVGGLQLFELPDGAGPEWARDLYIESLNT